MSNYTFENLKHGGLIKVGSKDDRNVTMSIDVFGGFTSLCVFTGAGGKPWKVNLPRKTIGNIIIILRKMQANPSPVCQPIFLNKYEEVDGKKGYRQYGCIRIGIDETSTLFVDISANDLSGRHIFPIRQDPRYDFSNTDLTEKELLQGLLEFLINEFTTATTMAERMSDFKRPSGQQGGNRSGGYQQRQNSGNQQNQQSGTFSSMSDDNELHV